MIEPLTGTFDEVIGRLLVLGILVNPRDDLINLSEKFKTQVSIRNLELLKGKAENFNAETFNQAQMLAICDIAECPLSVNEITDFLNTISNWTKDIK